MRRQRELSPRCKPRGLDLYQERRVRTASGMPRTVRVSARGESVAESLSAGCQNFYAISTALRRKIGAGARRREGSNPCGLSLRSRSRRRRMPSARRRWRELLSLFGHQRAIAPPDDLGQGEVPDLEIGETLEAAPLELGVGVGGDHGVADGEGAV